MVADGADILDVGGESTRPGAEPLPAGRRAAARAAGHRAAGRARPRSDLDRHLQGARRARGGRARRRRSSTTSAGCSTSRSSASVAAETGAALVLMHTRGRSRDMYDLAGVRAMPPAEVASELRSRRSRAPTRAGVSREAIVVDPGLASPSAPSTAFEVLAHLDTLARARSSDPVGPVAQVVPEGGARRRAPAEREWGTAAAVTASVLLGAHIVRVHGVAWRHASTSRSRSR